MMFWLLQTGEQLPIRTGIRKMRTALLADALVDRGHQVVWWASTFDHLTRSMLWDEDTDVLLRPGLMVKALRGFAYPRNVSLTRYLSYRKIARKFRRLAPLLPRPDAVVASLPDHLLAHEAVLFARFNGIPVVVDVRDQWPEIFLELAPGILRPAVRLLLRGDFRRFHETVRKADALTSMMSQILRWASSSAQRPANALDRVFPIGARRLVEPPQGSLSGPFQSMLQACRDKRVVVFIGSFGKYSNPMVLVRAARNLQGVPDLVFIIAGGGRFQHEVAKESQGLENVILPGWLDESEMAALLSAASIGVMPSSEVRDIFSNKAFSYMSAGLPIIASVQGELRHLMEQFQIGCYFPPNDHISLAKGIRGMIADPALLADMSRRTSALFEAHFDAEKIYAEFADYVEKIAGRSGGSVGKSPGPGPMSPR